MKKLFLNGVDSKGKEFASQKFALWGANSFLKELILIEMEWQSCFPGNILNHLNSLTTKNTEDNFSSASFQKLLSLSYIIFKD